MSRKPLGGRDGAGTVYEVRNLRRVSDSNIYEAIVTPTMVERAVKATLADYISDYLGELERVEGYAVDQIARPAGIITSSEFAKWDGDQLPLILIVSPGLDGKPVKRTGDGAHEAAWSVTVAAIVSDVDEIETRRLMGAYAGAIRAALVQHKALRSTLHPQGFAQFVAWTDESYSDIPFADTRALDSCRVVFSVGVESVVTQMAGPRAPSSTPGVDPGDWPAVTGVGITVTPEKAAV